MNDVISLASARPVAQARPEGYETAATSRGRLNGAVSSQWCSRPQDERFTSLFDLHAFTKSLADASLADVYRSNELRVLASQDNADLLQVVLPKTANSKELLIDPTHFAFGQLCSLTGAPAKWLRKIHAKMAALNLQYALHNHKAEVVKGYVHEADGTARLRAVTGPDYGRIFDHAIVSEVMKIAGDGTGKDGFHWKVPGCIDWSKNVGAGMVYYNPMVDVTKDTTTLYASDRDLNITLVDDLHPIEIGTLDNGKPDLVFRAFTLRNSEVGFTTYELDTCIIRGVCMNRNFWGEENRQTVTIRHSKYAERRFLEETMPALEAYAEASTGPLLQGIATAKATIVARNEEERVEFLRKRGFTKETAQMAVDACLAEEGHPAESVFDFVQGLTAVARNLPHQDARLDLEKRAAKLAKAA
jgi:hypothetical protein